MQRKQVKAGSKLESSAGKRDSGIGKQEPKVIGKDSKTGVKDGISIATEAKSVDSSSTVKSNSSKSVAKTSRLVVNESRTVVKHSKEGVKAVVKADSNANVGSSRNVVKESGARLSKSVRKSSADSRKATNSTQRESKTVPKGRYTIGVKYGGDTVPQAPFRVQANPTGNASKCKVSGPGVKNPLVGKPSNFEVDASKAGRGKVNPKVRNPVGDELPCEVKEVDDNVYACCWTPEEPGEHLVDVNFGGEPVRGSPFKAKAVDGPDTSPINTDDLASQLADEPVIDLPVESCLDCSEMEPGY